jgi:hypothetical protein
MSRYGGFRVGKARILNDWDNRKSPSRSVEAPTKITEFDYSTAQGIWTLQSTTQFPKNSGISELYSFTTATFTPGAATGPNGPSLAQASAGLEGPEIAVWSTEIDFFNVTNGIQQWTVPKTGVYRIQAYGAQGGTVSATSIGGAGASMQGDFELTQGQVLNILAGQRGTQTPLSTANKGGGGGSFVWLAGTSGDPLIAAGGGGGSQASASGVGGVTTTAGTAKSDSTGTPGVGGNGTRNGAGWYTDGNTINTTAGGGSAPLAILNGGAGGSGYNAAAQGGFGGGGGGGGSPSTTQAAGGGGGYSGGAGVETPATAGGGGGGSFNSGGNQINEAAVNLGNGKVTITLL